jgi:hypothetical protein
MRSTVFAAPAQAPVWPWIANPTAGHLQGIAALEGQVLADAHITLFREGAWVRELSAASDGWYGAVELEPGNYTIAIRDRRDTGRAATFEVVVRAGEVTSGP